MIAQMQVPKNIEALLLLTAKEFDATMEKRDPVDKCTSLNLGNRDLCGIIGYVKSSIGLH